MRWWEKVAQIDRKFAWSFLGVLIACVVGGLTIYQLFFKDDHLSVRFDILVNARVLDVKEEIKELDILYEGVDIRKSSQSLSVMTLRIQNDGSRNILKGYYDSKDPFGLALTEGKIIKAPELIETSNDYLKKHLDPNLISDQKLTFSNVILETDDFFIIKLLILHPDDEQPEVYPIGKIAGVRQFRLAEPFREMGKVSIWSRAFKGNLGIQLIRIVGYICAFIILIICIILPIALISDWREKKNRKKISVDFRKAVQVKISENAEFLFNNYVSEGTIYLRRIERLLSKDRLDKVCKAIQKEEEELDSTECLAKEYMELRYLMSSHHFGDRVGDRVVARELLKARVVEKKNDIFTLDEQVLKVFEAFTSYLRKHRHFKEDIRDSQLFMRH